MAIPAGVLTNWAGNVEMRPAAVHQPSDLDSLRRLVAASSSLRVLGSRHSFSNVVASSGDVVLLDRMPPAIEIDPEAATVRVGGGVTYAQLLPTLHAAGWALPNLASLPHITIAGAVSTGTHGSGDTQRVLGTAIRQLTIVGPGGDPRTIQEGDDDFAGSVVALGTLGLVTEVVLSLEPAYEMTQRVFVDVPLPGSAAELDAVLGSAYSVSLFTDWRSGAGSAFLKDRVDRPVRPRLPGHESQVTVHPVPGMPTDFCTEQHGVPGPWHERLPHFRAEFVPGAGEELQSEYFVARDHAPDAVARLGAMGDLLAPLIHCGEIRSVRGDELWLSPAYGRDTVSFHFTWLPDPQAVAPVLRAVEDALLPLGARPHWGKLTATAPGALLDSYPCAARFVRLRDRVDPDGVFLNDHLRAVLHAR